MLEPPRRGGSYECPQSMFWADIRKKYQIFFILKCFLFSIYLNRSVFVMVHRSHFYRFVVCQDNLLYQIKGKKTEWAYPYAVKGINCSYKLRDPSYLSQIICLTLEALITAAADDIHSFLLFFFFLFFFCCFFFFVFYYYYYHYCYYYFQRK